ncbi:MAG: hypothetical protein K6F61_00840 [Clostridiales bacterium]|nr:hypothetical protein [Clostridiales bacterium]
MDAAVSAAREKLNQATPLKNDCGRVCGARCCRPMEGEETGMMLFPGEAEAYAGKPGWKVRKTARGDLVVCPGSCRREERPLSCRLFPLLPVIDDGGAIRVVTDLRAKAVCPLARQGKSAMDPAFIDAVREAGELLARSDEQAVFLDLLADEQEQLKELRKKFI